MNLDTGNYVHEFTSSRKFEAKGTRQSLDLSRLMVPYAVQNECAFAENYPI